MLLTPHGSVFLCENPFFQLHETQYWWEYKKTFQNIKYEISSECWENWIFCFIDLKLSESPTMKILVPNWRAYLALWLVNSLSFISTTKVTLSHMYIMWKGSVCATFSTHLTPCPMCTDVPTLTYRAVGTGQEGRLPHCPNFGQYITLFKSERRQIMPTRLLIA